MGLTVTIDATKGGEHANSYVTLEAANETMIALYGWEEWVTLDDEDKKRLLMQATMQIDMLPIAYGRESTSQALAFPTVKDGFARAKRAAVHQALYLLRNLDAFREAENMALVGVTSESTGPLSRSMAGFNPMKLYSPAVYKELSEYVDYDMKIHRG